MSWESQMRFTDDEWIDPKIAAALAEPRVRDVVSRTLATLSYDQQEKALEVVRDVALGKVSLDEFSEALIDRARVEDEKAYEIDGELYAEVWSAFEEDLEKQVAVYAELHPEAALPPTASEADSVETLADGIVAKSRLFGDDQVMMKRLRSLVVSYLKDVRDEAETRAMLEKPPKTGGLGLAPTVAASVLLFAAESRPELAKKNESLGRLRVEAEQARAAAEVMRKEKIAALRAGTLVISAPEPAAVQVLDVPSVGSSVDAKKEIDEDDADIAKIKAVLSARGVVTETATTAAPMTAVSPLDSAVDETLAALGGTFASEELKNRMRMLTSFYFRDLRDHLETTSKLTMPVASGGMGMTDEDAVMVMGLLKARNGAYHAASLEKVKEGKQQFVAERQASVVARETAAIKQETDSLNKVFASVTGTKLEVPPAAPSAPRAIPVTAIGRTGEQTVVTARVPEARPMAVPVPSALPAPVLFEKPATAPPSSTPKPIPAPASVQVPAATNTVAPITNMQLPPTPPVSSKPSMADVSGAPRLTGPVEELKALTIKDLRQLSRDPREALLKLRDKIDLLGEQSFDVKTKGIKAWQESEVNGMYLQLLRASLEGVPVTEVIAAKEAKGEQGLNKAEFDAIMAFNRELRFG